MATDDPARKRNLETTLAQIEKDFGKGSIMRLGSKESRVPVSVIPSGSISLDAALGVGGVPPPSPNLAIRTSRSREGSSSSPVSRTLKSSSLRKLSSGERSEDVSSVGLRRDPSMDFG